MTDEGSLKDGETRVQRCSEFYGRLRAVVAKSVVGHEKLIEQLMIAILARGHMLLTGAPGVGKTLLLRCMAEATRLDFSRVRCTPDLMPTDLFGPEIGASAADSCSPIAAGAGSQGAGDRREVTSTLSANFILVEDIDRAPPKTQWALMEAMEQREVFTDGAIHRLPTPFFLLAAENPWDREDTCLLRQATLDRFLMHVRVDYPSQEDEWEIARRVTFGQRAPIEVVAAPEEILSFQELVTKEPLSDPVLQCARALVRASRPNSEEAPGFVDRWVAWGAGPRGLVALVACAKARAFLRGRRETKVADVRAVAPAVLRHRIAPNEVAEAEAISSDTLVEMLIEAARSENGTIPGVPGIE
jgi:MoxR-like ATPase